MKKVVLFILITLSSIWAKAQSLKYFNIDGKEISKTTYERLDATNQYFPIPGDSTNHVNLISRKQEGNIANYQKFKEAIENQIGKKLSHMAPTVFIYYPGKDKCNTSGVATPSMIKAWHKELAKGIFKSVKTTPIYVCKDKGNIDDKRDGVLPWQNDPDHIVENTFFKHHYPCGSFVVIDPNGNYISYLGEFMKEQVWDIAKSLKNLMKRNK